MERSADSQFVRGKDVKHWQGENRMINMGLTTSAHIYIFYIYRERDADETDKPDTALCVNVRPPALSLRENTDPIDLNIFHSLSFPC